MYRANEGGLCRDFIVQPTGLTDPLINQWSQYALTIHWNLWDGQLAYDAI